MPDTFSNSQGTALSATNGLSDEFAVTVPCARLHAKLVLWEWGQGGLADSVEHFDPATGRGTGCIFNDYDAPAVRWAVGTVLGWYDDRGSWQRLIRNAMAKDFSWQRQIGQYEQLYAAMLGL